jgi:hypothetical protein
VLVFRDDHVEPFRLLDHGRAMASM